MILALRSLALTVALIAVALALLVQVLDSVGQPFSVCVPVPPTAEKAVPPKVPRPTRATRNGDVLLITVGEKDSFRWTLNGTAPSSVLGMILDTNSSVVIHGAQNIRDFRLFSLTGPTVVEYEDNGRFAVERSDVFQIKQ